MALPLVEGLTETHQDPVHLRLAEFLSQRPGGGGEDVATAIGSLERAFRHEGDERLKAKLAAAITLLRGDDKPYDKDRGDK